MAHTVFQPQKRSLAAPTVAGASHELSKHLRRRLEISEGSSSQVLKKIAVGAVTPVERSSSPSVASTHSVGPMKTCVSPGNMRVIPTRSNNPPTIWQQQPRYSAPPFPNKTPYYASPCTTNLATPTGMVSPVAPGMSRIVGAMTCPQYMVAATAPLSGNAIMSPRICPSPRVPPGRPLSTDSIKSSMMPGKSPTAIATIRPTRFAVVRQGPYNESRTSLVKSPNALPRPPVLLPLRMSHEDSDCTERAARSARSSLDSAREEMYCPQESPPSAFQRDAATGIIVRRSKSQERAGANEEVVPVLSLLEAKIVKAGMPMDSQLQTLFCSMRDRFADYSTQFEREKEHRERISMNFEESEQRSRESLAQAIQEKEAELERSQADLERSRLEVDDLRQQLYASESFDAFVSPIRRSGPDSEIFSISPSPNRCSPIVSVNSPLWNGVPMTPEQPMTSTQTGDSTAHSMFSALPLSNLRVIMANPKSTAAEIEEAIAGEKALLSEAERELGARQFRDRRAAFEALHEASNSRSESALAAAIAEARRTNVDAEDIEKAEDKLKALLSLTDSEKRIADVQEKLVGVKRQAFLLVKRNDICGLQDLLDGWDEEVVGVPSDSPALTQTPLRWQAWKNHAGRTLQQFSEDFRRDRIQALLHARISREQQQPRAESAEQERVDELKEKISQLTTRLRSLSPDLALAASEEGRPSQADPHSAPSALPAPTQTDGATSPLPLARQANGAERPSSVAAVAPERSPEWNTRGLSSSFNPSAVEEAILHSSTKSTASPDMCPEATPEIHDLANNGANDSQNISMDCGSAPHASAPCSADGRQVQSEAELRTRAFRAVVKDDTQVLQEVIADLPKEVWSEWHNKAGKDLLTLSEERGSSAAYSFLTRQLGKLTERKREAFAQGAAVWVFMEGEIQPRRATVMEDAPAEANYVLLEYWDGDAAASYVDRNQVLPSC